MRQWQELFFGERYSQTRMLNPDYKMIAEAYGIRCLTVESREELEGAVRDSLSDDAPVLVDVHVMEDNNVMPMIPPGKGINQIMLTPNEWYE